MDKVVTGFELIQMMEKEKISDCRIEDISTGKFFYYNDKNFWDIDGFDMMEYYRLSQLLESKFRIHKNNEEENKSMQISKLSFGKAIELLKTGYQLQREGWNGKNQYIELATCISYKNTEGEIINADHNAIGNAAIAFVGTSGVQLGWLASQSDMLAEDWRIRY